MIIPQHSPKELVVSAPPDELNPRRSVMSTLTPRQRVSTMRGRKVKVVAELPDGTREDIEDAVSLANLRAHCATLNHQMFALPAPNLAQINNIIFRVTSAQALREIMGFVNFSMTKNRGHLGHIRAQSPNSLFKDFELLEVARAIEFDHVVDELRERLNSRFYRGAVARHKYTMPVADVRMIYDAASTTQTSDRVKRRILCSVAQAYLDGNLSNVKAVERLMVKMSEFGRAADAETQAREAVKKVGENVGSEDANTVSAMSVAAAQHKANVIQKKSSNKQTVEENEVVNDKTATSDKTMVNLKKKKNMNGSAKRKAKAEKLKARK